VGRAQKSPTSIRKKLMVGLAALDPPYEGTTAPVGEFFKELLRATAYKRSQGRITRQVTFGALAVTVLLGVWRMSLTLRAALGAGEWAYLLHVPYTAWYYLPVRPAVVYYCLPAILLLVGWWTAYRAVNLPAFADFLIAVEAEMNKVSWPSRSELMRASMVVMASILFLGFILAGYDFLWIWMFHFLHFFSS
jgi:preprotein translocase subunit SecE